MSREACERPRRPAIPLSLYALLLVLVSVRMVMRHRMGLTELLANRVAVVTFAVVVPLAALLLWRRAVLRTTVLALLASVLVGMLLGTVTLGRERSFLLAAKDGAVSTWELRIATDPVPRDAEYRCKATVGFEGKAWGDVWLTLPTRMDSGAVVRCVGRFAPNGDDEWGTTSRMQGVWGSVRGLRILETRDPDGPSALLLHARTGAIGLLRPASSRERALLAACVLGWRADLVSYGLDKTFSRCGLAHLVAVSGSHLAVVASLIGIACGHLRVSPSARAILLFLAMGVFVLLCGSPPSAVRAWAMACSAQGAWLAGRRSHSLSAVSVAGLAMVLLEPTAAGQIGFLLSFASVCALCLFAPYGTYALEVMLRRTGRMHAAFPWLPVRRLGQLRDFLCEAIAMSVVAQLATMPLVAESFGEMSPVGIVSSAAVAYPFGMLMALGVLSVLLWWIPPVQSAALWVCDWLARALVLLCTWCANLPFPLIRLSTHVGLAYLSWGVLLLILVFWPKCSRRAVAGCLLAVVGILALQGIRWRYFSPPRVCVLDVGQGDAILVQDGASAVLVDAGPGKAVVDALARNHVTHLDAVVLTHLHADHYAGVSDLMGNVPCEQVIVACGVAGSMDGGLRDACEALTGEPVEEVSYGDVIRVAGFRLRVVWPRVEVDGDQNSESLELLASYDEGPCRLEALLTGDAERDETGSVLAHGDVGDIDLLKVGHHGSEVSLTQEQAALLDPEVSVASAGQNNSYGHPSQSCIDVLESCRSTFLCTKDVGDVEVRPGRDGPEVRVQSPP